MQASGYHPAFGPLQRDAERLIAAANEYLRPNQALDVLHIFFAALNIGDSLFSSLLTEKLTLTEIAEMTGGLRVEMRVNQEASDDHKITNRLRSCADAWVRHAADDRLLINEALIMWTLLTNQTVLQDAFPDLTRSVKDPQNAYDIVTAIAAKLRQSFITNDPSAVPQPSSLLQQALQSYLLPITVSATPEYHNEHAILMGNVVDSLAGSIEENSLNVNRLTVVVGRIGTPIREVGQALAEWFASNERFQLTRTLLEKYRKRVYTLDLFALSKMEIEPGKPRPKEILAAAMERVAQEGGTLLLNHLEVMQEESMAIPGFREKLANLGTTLALGIYELNEEEAKSADLNLSKKLGLLNIKQVAAAPYTAQQTQTLLKYYIKRWEERYGCTFTSDAFDHVIALEPGAWIGYRRETLPYLAIDLATATIAAAGNSVAQQESLTCAMHWLAELDDFERENTVVSPHTVERFGPIIAAIRGDIEALLHDPMPKTNAQGRIVITRGHVSANLICHNDSEFHYPPITPWIAQSARNTPQG